MSLDAELSENERLHRSPRPALRWPGASTHAWPMYDQADAAVRNACCRGGAGWNPVVFGCFFQSTVPVREGYSSLVARLEWLQMARMRSTG